MLAVPTDHAVTDFAWRLHGQIFRHVTWTLVSKADKATMYWPLETTRVLKALGDYISGALISIGLMHVGCVIDAFSTNTDFHCDQRSLPHDMKTCIVKLCF